MFFFLKFSADQPQTFPPCAHQMFSAQSCSNLFQVLNDVVDALYRLQELLVAVGRVSALAAVRQVQARQVLETNHARKVFAEAFTGLDERNDSNA